MGRNKVKSLISLGSEIAGAVSGEAVAFLTRGIGGAAAGGAVKVLVSKSLSDIANRVLSNREKVRIGATAAFALAKIELYRAAGYKPREDGFFGGEEKGRSDAEEIFEGVLLKAKNEHEEKKARILGNIFANIAFSAGFSLGEANHLLRIAESLTYRQMCTLSLIERKHQIQEVNLREDSYREYKGEKVFYETISILQEAYELYNLGLIACKNKSGTGYEAMLGWTDPAPNRLELTPMGKRYYEIMGLEGIAEEEIREVAQYLS
jgi:hypothetical protein